MMRIAMLSPLFESVPPRRYGGTERVVYSLCQGLTAAGMEVDLFASGDSKTAARLCPVMDEALRLRTPAVEDPVSYHLKMLSMISAAADRYDVIHNHHDYWMLPLSRMTRTPILTTAHGRMDLPDLPHVYFGFPNHSFVSISQAQRDPMPSLNWVSTIHHGIDVESFKFYKEPGKYLAFLGRISPEKKPEWAIEISKRSGTPLKIAAKIEGPASQAYFDSKIKPHVDGKFIEYVGEISEGEKSEFLGNALALVFPIDWPEPFGLVVIESLACGTPILARPCGSVPEVLQDGVTGFCDMNLETLARRVQDLSGIKRPGCRQWVQEKFSMQRMTEDYIRVYRHLAEGTRRFNRHRWNFLHPVQRTADGNS